MYPYNFYSNNQDDTNILSQDQSQNQKQNNNNLWQPDINKKILEMLEIAIKDEIQDKNYYIQLAKKINNKQDIIILNQIIADEQKHYKLLLMIYKKLNNNQEPRNLKINPDDIKLKNNIQDDLSQAIFKELDNIEFYRRLLFLFLDLQIKDMIFEIITDEQSHAIKLNYLFSKYNSQNLNQNPK